MKRTLKTLLLASLLSFSMTTFAAPQCAVEAVEQAKKLLAFHRDPGNFTIDMVPEMVKELPSIRNPANKKQKFQVIEVWAYIYKGQYRMRLVYHHSRNACLLMGQEVLEIATL